MFFLEESAPLRPGFVAFLTGLRAGLSASAPAGFELYPESFDRVRFSWSEHEVEYENWLTRKYRLRPMDALVASGSNSTVLARRLQRQLWPGKPLLVMTDSMATWTNAPGANEVQLAAAMDGEGTLELALGMCPQARRVVIMGNIMRGYEAWDRRFEEGVRGTCAARGLAVERWPTMQMEAYKARLGGLGRHDVVLVPGLALKADGKHVNSVEVFPELSRASGAPLFALSDSFVGHGAVGGRCLRYARLGGEAAGMLASLLRGEPVASRVHRGHQVMIDWRQVERFGLETRVIPPDAEVLFRRPPLWETYRTEALAAVGVITVQGGLLAGLLVQRRRRRVAEARVAESEARFRLLVAAAFDGIVVVQDGMIADANDAFLRMVGCAMDGVAGRRIEDALPGLEEAWGEPVAGAAMEPRALEVRTGNGQRIHVEVRARKGMNEGRPAMFLAVQDVTEQRRLAREAGERQAELDHVGRVSLLGQMASSLAHELSQPVGAMLRNVATALRELAEPEPRVEELREILEDVQSDNRRARGVIDGLRALVRRRRGHVESVQLGVVAIEVAELVTSDARVRGIRMEWESEAGVGNIRADRVQVQQVVLNLLVNAMDAVDAAGAGRPGPAGEPRAKEVRLHVGRHGDGRVRLAVSDSGNGFSRESLERLFEPFYTTKAHGMGMGLVLCRRIVESHGGSMGVGASRDGGGQVWVEFPVEDEA